MTTALPRAEPPPRNTTPVVPREHGFWAILGVVVASALSQNARSGTAWFVAAAVVIAAVALGGVLGRRVRRSAAFQVAAAAALSVAGVPVQIAGGATLENAGLDAFALATVFASSALGVRACFARNSRRGSRHVTPLVTGSVALPITVAVLLAAVSARAHALSTFIAAAGALCIALLRPTAKELKAVGIALATIAVVAAIVLRLR